MRASRLVRLGLAAGVAVAWTVGAGGVAHADAPDLAGWWYKANQAPFNTVKPPPPPPDAPSDGLYLANDPSGPAAVAALHFTVAGGGGSPTVTLKAASGSVFGTVTPIKACPTGGSWSPAQAGDWGSAPSADCAKAGGGVDGMASSDGTSMSWKLTDAFLPDPTDYDMVFEPQGSVPFRVGIQKPDASALTGAAGGDASTGATDTSATGDASATSPDTGSSDASATATAVPDSSGLSSSSASSPSLDAGAGSPLPSVSSPTAAAAPAASAGPAPAVATPAAAHSANSNDRGERVMALVLLCGLGAALWWFGGQAERPPRLLGSLGGGGDAGTTGAEAAAPIGGIGRFARPRTGPPKPL